MAFERAITIDQAWLYTKNLRYAAQLTNVYKLHLSISSFFNENSHVKAAIDARLDKAVHEGVIPQYKSYRFHEIKKIAESEKKTIHQDDFRYINALPYTIYLYKEFKKNNFPAIVQLCKDLEKILEKIPAGPEEEMCISDLFLTKHVRFRQAIIDGVYCDSFNRGEELNELGKNSKYYNVLKAMVSTNLDEEKFHQAVESYKKYKGIFFKSRLTTSCETLETLESMEATKDADKLTSLAFNFVYNNRDTRFSQDLVTAMEWKPNF